MKALKAKDIEPASAKKTRRLQQVTRTQRNRGKTFEDLTKGERDLLLKAVAVKLGLIQDSEDA